MHERYTVEVLLKKAEIKLSLKIELLVISNNIYKMQTAEGFKMAIPSRVKVL